MRIAVRLLLKGGQLIGRHAPRRHAAWSGFWVGVLPRRALHRIDQVVYDWRGHYHSADHNTGGLMPWERAAITGYFGGVKRLVVIGVGAGREILALWRMGYEPDGFECNPTLVAAAGRILAEAGCPFTVRYVPRDQAPAGVERYQGAIVGWGAFSLMPGRPNRVEMLRGMRRLVPAGAPLMVSFLSRADDDARAASVSRVAAPLRRLLRRAPHEPGDDLLPNYIHRFSRGEVAEELSQGGFEMVRWEPQGPGGHDSGWAIGLAR